MHDHPRLPEVLTQGADTPQTRKSKRDPARRSTLAPLARSSSPDPKEDQYDLNP